jgi:peptide/nickel transport system substrate-binding protein
MLLLRFTLLTVLLLVSIARAPGQEEAPAERSELRIFEQTPHDEITLKDGSLIKVEPLALPQRKLPQKPRPGDKLIVHLLDQPDETYEVAWRDVAEVHLFEQMVLDKAQSLSAAGQFDEAYDYFDYLEQKYPNLAGLAEAVQKYIYQDAQNWQRRSQYDYVLALLDQLHRRNPGYPGLARALALVTDKLIEASLAKGEFQAARGLLRSLEQKYPQEPQLDQLKAKLRAMADQSLAEAQAEEAAGRLRQAQESCRKALELWPRHEAARKLLVQLHSQFPFVIVGVAQPLRNPQGRLDNWAAQRAGRLLRLPLMEFTGQGAEGGNYACPLGSAESADLGLRLDIRLQNGLRWPDGSPVTASDVSRTLLDFPHDDPASLAPWADFIERVNVGGPFSLTVRFKQAPAHPLALFGGTLIPPPYLPPATLFGPFQLGAQSENETVYTATDSGLARSPGSPRQIVERRFEAGRLALEAFRRHEVSLLDRVNPWEVEQFRGQPDVTVEPYAVNALHCLLVNHDHPLLANRIFRRALLYGIHREALLNVQLLRGRPLAGARLVSGPFPSGYACDNEVEVRPYEPRVAMMLADVALAEFAQAQPAADSAPRPAAGPASPESAAKGRPSARQASGSKAKAPSCPTLVLAHPADDVARLACRAIERQLKLIGIPLRLVELKPGEVALPGGKYDLVYVELRMAEPLVDVGRLFGPAGLVPLSSAYLRAALEQLASATDWKAARASLFEIHRIVANELPLLPLYELPEHFVYRRHVQGIGSQPASLYQNVTAWQMQPELPPQE